MKVFEIWHSGFVQRWHCNPDLASSNQTNAQHQWACAILAHCLWPDDLRLLQDALTHDIGEVNIGDVSAVAKNKNPQLKEIMDTVEGDNFKYLGIIKPRTCARLRLIDMAEAYIWAKKHAPHVMDKLGWPEMRSEILRLADDLGKSSIIEDLLER